jgi:hypothetical protein
MNLSFIFHDGLLGIKNAHTRRPPNYVQFEYLEDVNLDYVSPLKAAK